MASRRACENEGRKLDGIFNYRKEDTRTLKDFFCVKIYCIYYFKVKNSTDKILSISNIVNY